MLFSLVVKGGKKIVFGGFNFEIKCFLGGIVEKMGRS